VSSGATPPVGRLLDHTDRVVVVTGVSRGIGQGIARRFGEAGASLVLHCRHDRTAAEVLAAELGERATVVVGDLLEPAVADGVAATAVEHFGRLDAWVSNAGVQPVAGLMEVDDAAFRAVVEGNLTTAFVATRAAASRMVDGGAIVNVASIEAFQPAAGHSHYAAAKAAVVAHTRAAALELGPSGVRVNAVAPGLIDRPGLADAWPEGVERWMTACPLGRLGQPEDVGDACLFLASPAARWITGSVLVVDGGVLARPTW
jgi:NAD(P)-dependent dehydrogenase (short-subunit alcohol dehydrogenase family)